MKQILQDHSEDLLFVKEEEEMRQSTTIELEGVYSTPSQQDIMRLLGNVRGVTISGRRVTVDHDTSYVTEYLILHAYFRIFLISFCPLHVADCVCMFSVERLQRICRTATTVQRAN